MCLIDIIVAYLITVIISAFFMTAGLLVNGEKLDRDEKFLACVAVVLPIGNIYLGLLVLILSIWTRCGK